MKIEIMKANISEKERKEIMSQMTGQKLDGTVDYPDFNRMADNEIFKLNKREQAKEEILEYILGRIKAEFKLTDDGEALLKWDEYKARLEVMANSDDNV